MLTMTNNQLVEDENEEGSDFSRSSINSNPNPLERTVAAQARLKSKKTMNIKGTKLNIEKYFPERSYQKLKKSLIRMKDRKFFVNECVICLEPINNDSMCRMLSCFHIFHQHCVMNWLVTNASCPMCNKDLSKI